MKSLSSVALWMRVTDECLYIQMDRSRNFMFAGIFGISQSKVCAKFGEAAFLRSENLLVANRLTC